MIDDFQRFLRRPLFIQKGSIFLSSATAKIQCCSSGTVDIQSRGRIFSSLRKQLQTNRNLIQFHSTLLSDFY